MIGKEQQKDKNIFSGNKTKKSFLNDSYDEAKKADKGVLESLACRRI